MVPSEEETPYSLYCKIYFVNSICSQTFIFRKTKTFKAFDYALRDTAPYSALVDSRFTSFPSL